MEHGLGLMNGRFWRKAWGQIRKGRWGRGLPIPVPLRMSRSSLASCMTQLSPRPLQPPVALAPSGGPDHSSIGTSTLSPSRGAGGSCYRYSLCYLAALKCLKVASTFRVKPWRTQIISKAASALKRKKNKIQQFNSRISDSVTGSEGDIWVSGEPPGGLSKPSSQTAFLCILLWQNQWDEAHRGRIQPPAPSSGEYLAGSSDAFPFRIWYRSKWSGRTKLCRLN